MKCGFSFGNLTCDRESHGEDVYHLDSVKAQYFGFFPITSAEESHTPWSMMRSEYDRGNRPTPPMSYLAIHG
jgi:hypothetical protein